MLFKNLAITFALMLVSFFSHSFYVFEGVFPEILIKSYFVNYMMASLVFIVILRLRKLSPELLGFYFLGGSMFKFIIFFLLFLPFFKSDGVLSKQEFFIFFIPYIVVLFVEVVLLIKVLNKE